MSGTVLRLLDLIGDRDVRVVVVAGSRNWTDRVPIESALIDLRVPERDT